jgi:hypothetical protein
MADSSEDHLKTSQDLVLIGLAVLLDPEIVHAELEVVPLELPVEPGGERLGGGVRQVLPVQLNTHHNKTPD